MGLLRIYQKLTVSRSEYEKIVVVEFEGWNPPRKLFVHEDLLNRSSPYLRKLVENGKIMLAASGWDTISLFYDMKKYVHFLYKSEVSLPEVVFDSSRHEEIISLVEDWIFALRVQDVSYCNAVMDKLIEKTFNNPHALLLTSQDVFVVDTGHYRETPLWRWYVDAVGGMVKVGDLDDTEPNKMTQPKFLVKDVLAKVLRRFEHPGSHHKKTLADRKQYHVSEETIKDVCQVWDSVE